MSRFFCALSVCLLLVACDRERPDVLAEFPPPRLARDVAAAARHAESVPADCKATWRLIGRTSRETYLIPGHGRFEVQGHPPKSVSGSVTLDPLESTPRLRDAVSRELQTRDQSATWVWRLLSTEQPALGYEGLAQGAANGDGLRGLTELELNGVRTQQNHSLAIKLTAAGDGTSELTFDTLLRLDLRAHHIRGLTLLDDSTPRRADLSLQCRLRTADDGQ